MLSQAASPHLADLNNPPGASLAQSIIENNLLEGSWRRLEPLPDRPFPVLDVQREFFTIGLRRHL